MEERRRMIPCSIIFVGLCLTFASAGEDDLVTLSFGDSVGDHFGPYASDAVTPEISLEGKYHYFGREYTSLFISENGVISFDGPFADPFPRTLPLTVPSVGGGTSTTPPIIAGFWGDINVPKNGGAIFYAEITQARRERFGQARAHVMNLLMEGFGHNVENFAPTHIFVCTWESVHENNPGIAKRAVTFQIVLVTDSTRTYALLLYSDVRWDTSNGHGVLVGFNAGDGVRSYTHPFSNSSILDLDFSTNAGSIGAHVYRVDQNDIIVPTNDEIREEICVVTFNVSEEAGKEFTCTCPTEERPVLADNNINCLYKPLAVRFHNDTPLVVEDSLTAYFTVNRPDVQLLCNIPKIDRGVKHNCSSGVYQRRNLPTSTSKKLSLRIVAFDKSTKERAVLRGYFYVLPVTSRRGSRPCAVTIINTSTEEQSGSMKVEFRGAGFASHFKCRVDGGRNQECQSPFVLNDLEAGDHRAVIIPTTPLCTRRDTKASSYRFTVQSS